MRPLAFQFKETPEKENLDFSLIEYDTKLNLSIYKKTMRPAIDILTIDTNTFTKADNESSDSDNNVLNALMDTQTLTLKDTEATDSDNERRALLTLLDTTTITESREDIDQDQDRL